MAVARSIYSHLPPGGTPLWLGFRDVGNADPATALAALASMTNRRRAPLPAIPTSTEVSKADLALSTLVDAHARRRALRLSHAARSVTAARCSAVLREDTRDPDKSVAPPGNAIIALLLVVKSEPGRRGTVFCFRFAISRPSPWDPGRVDISSHVPMSCRWQLPMLTRR